MEQVEGALESQTERELQLPFRVGTDAADLPEGAVVQTHVGVGEGRRIGQVECIRGEMHGNAFLNGEVLANRCIQIPEGGSHHKVAAQRSRRDKGAVLPVRGDDRGVAEGRGVEPFSQVLGIADLAGKVGAVGHTAADKGGAAIRRFVEVIAGCDRDGRA